MMIFYYDQTQDTPYQEGKSLTSVWEEQLLTPNE